MFPFKVSLVWNEATRIANGETLNVNRFRKKVYKQTIEKQEGPEGPGSLTWGKGHSVANNREPQGQNLNNFGRGPFDDVIY